MTSRGRWIVALWPIPPLAAALAAIFSLASPTPGQAQPDPSSFGGTLFAAHCASCHGSDGTGITDRGPALTDEGRAAVNFVLRTGRMPMADPKMQATRGPVRFSEEEIVALVDYAGAFGDGPDIPNVDVAIGDLTAGGETFRINCAACHVASGSGAAIGGGREAPSLMKATPTEIGEAILIGPGAMPSFQSLQSSDINDVAAYVVDLQERKTTGPDTFGGAGPVAEGLAAWLLGLLPLIALTRWIGAPHEGRDTNAIATIDLDTIEPEA
jgi:ubiquinol-cytochrome c reductase cytochrome c subunit